VRTKLFGATEATYSGYTCYTGIAKFVPPDIESVGWVGHFSNFNPHLTILVGHHFIMSCWEADLNFFGWRLGHKQYFVSSDVGAGKMQWYAFHQEPAGGVDTPNGMCF
jgi:zeaxanthin epoxidase